MIIWDNDNPTLFKDMINQVICGDCMEVIRHIPNQSIDLVLTDPPYPKEYEYCWDYLVRIGSEKLKIGGSLITLLGHYQMDTVIKKFDGKLRFWWVAGMPQKGRTHLVGKMVSTAWKPALWYVKEKRNPNIRTMPCDMLPSRNDGKCLHKWQQSLGWFLHWCLKNTLDDDLVLDPFLGSGTTAVACKQLGRNFIGIEKELKYCEIAERRLAQEYLF